VYIIKVGHAATAKVHFYFVKESTKHFDRLSLGSLSVAKWEKVVK